MNIDRLAPDLERLKADFDELSTLVDDDEPGWTRRSYSEPYRYSREWVKARMVDAGLTVTHDHAGNLVGRLSGSGTSEIGALVTGSHTDTVHGGGRFDGVVGVLGAIEAVRCLREAGERLHHDVCVIDFVGEEISEFGIGCIGSQLLTGVLPVGRLDLRNDDGLRLGDAMINFGVDPNAALSTRWEPSDVAAFVELHIEQGPLLERRGLDIGVVTAIAGIELLDARFAGRADHAGTTPMTERQDALAAAAAAVLKIEQMGCSGNGTVATVSQVISDSGGKNIVASSASLRAEMRSTSKDWIGLAKQQLAEEIVTEAKRRGVDVDMDWITDEQPVVATTGVHDVIAETAQSLGRSWAAIPSGAGHDAAFMAGLGPMGMIFVASRDGRSHCPEEWTDIEAVGAGVHTLAATLVRLDTGES